ncbi:amino acid oxidase [Thraustotheca clavata]|uniref:Amino acid oxidase n=1 Tax=Thraustotheca clavata TaxID=74557 RepID=A0A0A7CM26_9STRA|nr:secreted protein [Thraustotheca clavata]OQR95838.1 amino acid oxidase [Thraustotheca clavata]
MKSHVVVVGAGVIGLTTALQLSMDGVPADRITIVAKDLSEATVSSVSAALWETPPYEMEADTNAIEWCAATLHKLTELQRDHPEAGIHTVPSFTVSEKKLKPNVDAKNTCTSYQAWESPSKLNATLRRAGVPELSDVFRYFESYDAPIASMNVYMPWLNAQLAERGIKVIQKEIPDLYTLAKSNVIVVNCTGLASHKIDPKVYPCKGQIVVINAPWVRAAILDMDSGAYMIPRTNGTLICGGTSENNKWDFNVEDHVTEQIMKKCSNIVPSITKAPILAVKVGHRPKRHGGVRLEGENSPHGGVIVHNYGHGGSGLCCSWGTAVAASKLVLAHMRQPSKL